MMTLLRWYILPHIYGELSMENAPQFNCLVIIINTQNDRMDNTRTVSKTNWLSESIEEPEK